MNIKNKIVIATGGTGGHVFPSISLANFLTNYYNIEIFTDERGLKYLKNDKNLKIKKIASSKYNLYFCRGYKSFFINLFLVYVFN